MDLEVVEKDESPSSRMTFAAWCQAVVPEISTGDRVSDVGEPPKDLVCRARPSARPCRGVTDAHQHARPQWPSQEIANQGRDGRISRAHSLPDAGKFRDCIIQHLDRPLAHVLEHTHRVRRPDRFENRPASIEVRTIHFCRVNHAACADFAWCVVDFSDFTGRWRFRLAAA
jgi:hypothetical protein